MTDTTTTALTLIRVVVNFEIDGAGTMEERAAISEKFADFTAELDECAGEFDAYCTLASTRDERTEMLQKHAADVAQELAAPTVEQSLDDRRTLARDLYLTLDELARITG